MQNFGSTLVAPALTYCDCMWKSIESEGWAITRYTFNDEDGNLRHFVRARNNGDELICSAPTLALAVQVIYNQFVQLST